MKDQAYKVNQESIRPQGKKQSIDLNAEKNMYTGISDKIFKDAITIMSQEVRMNT